MKLQTVCTNWVVVLIIQGKFRQSAKSSAGEMLKNFDPSKQKTQHQHVSLSLKVKVGA